jgi:hypothetical protein
MRGALGALLLIMVAACGNGEQAAEGVATYEPHGQGGNTALLEGTHP